jgi:hypothetical protein
MCGAMGNGFRILKENNMDYTISVTGTNLEGLNFSATNANKTAQSILTEIVNAHCAAQYALKQEADFASVKQKIASGAIKIADVLSLDKAEVK